MDEALALHRFHFAFTATFHYLFPQITMGLALLILVLKTLGLRTGSDKYDTAARFWIRIFAVSFVFGVVSGIPLEFQFGTNWARFSKAAGGVLGQTLAMEGVFAFFLESSFLGLLLFGERKLGPRGHWFASLVVFLGSWLSGYFIIATNAWMQHPVGYRLREGGDFVLDSLGSLLLNPWAGWQFLHNQLGSVVTAAFLFSGVGALYLLLGRHREFAVTSLRLGVVTGLAASVLLLFPTGDGQGKNIARHQPVTLAAMEGLFETVEGAPMVIMGQPDTVKMQLDNPLMIPNALSFVTWRRWDAQLRGLDSFPREDWPSNVPLLFYSFHIMVGLGTLFILLGAVAAYKLRGGKLFESKATLWALMLATPFPIIANTAGWTTAEAGRQPWLVYGLMRTSDGASPFVSAGNTLFTLIGFMGIYALLSVLFLFLIHHEIERGPAAAGTR